MISLRHNRFWPLWLAVLTLVFTGIVSPVQAAACAAGPAPVQASAAADGAKQCAGMEPSTPCCCHPGETVSEAHHAPADAALTAPGCGCAVHAPDAPPATVTRTSALLAAPDLALLPVASVEIGLPRTAAWTYAAPATGPPRVVVRSTGPSRAPPAP